MTKERVFQKSYAAQLLRIAKADLDAAQVLAKSRTIRPENILFHVGQTIEKSLKAVLCKRGLAVPLTHDLNLILDRIPKDLIVPQGDTLDDLSQFATIRRYEEGEAIFHDEEISLAIDTALKVLSWAEKTV